MPGVEHVAYRRSNRQAEHVLVLQVGVDEPRPFPVLVHLGQEDPRGLAVIAPFDPVGDVAARYVVAVCEFEIMREVATDRPLFDRVRIAHPAAFEL